MTSKHATPTWRKTVRIIQAQVRQAQERGDVPVCWRCGRPLPEGPSGRLVYDVGHLNPAGGEGPDNAGPEHRVRTGVCVGNRNHGGQMGARKTNAKRQAKSGFIPLPWA